MVTYKQKVIVIYLEGEVLSANDVIERVYFDDVMNGVKRETCQFYNHLNKEFDKLKKKRLIEIVGHKTGKHKMEKTWRLTLDGIALASKLETEVSVKAA